MNAFVGTLFVPNFWKLMQTIQEKYLTGLFPDRTPGAIYERQHQSATATDEKGV